jgi:hypothetical protein
MKTLNVYISHRKFASIIKINHLIKNKSIMSTKTELCKAWILLNVIGNLSLQNNMSAAHEKFNAERTANSLPEVSKGVFREQFNLAFPDRVINRKTVQSAEFLKNNPKYLDMPKAQGHAALTKTLPDGETVAPNVFNRAYDAALAARAIAIPQETPKEETPAEKMAEILEAAIKAEGGNGLDGLVTVGEGVIPGDKIPATKKSKKK